MEVIQNLRQGDLFTINGKVYIKLPDTVECYGCQANSMNINTGTMTNFSPIREVKVINSKKDEFLESVLEDIE